MGGAGRLQGRRVGGYGTILVLFAIAGGIAATLHFLTSALGPRAPNPLKSEPFECGNIPKNLTKRVSVKFYVVALLFILFDMETVFLFPWAVIFVQQKIDQANSIPFYAMLLFLGVLSFAIVYAWRKGVLEWQR